MSDPIKENELNEDSRQNIPLFGSWRGWYAFVITFLIILIVLFYLITKTFS